MTAIQTNTEAQAKAAKEPLAAPPFWPTSHLDEYRVAGALRKLIDPTGIDIHVGQRVAEYGAELQAMSGSAAELMARMRMTLEEARNKAILDAMATEGFYRMSATLQNKWVDGKIAVYHAA